MRVRLLGEDLVLFSDRSGKRRADRRVLPAPARVARVRDPDRGRDSLPVSRLEVRRHRQLPRAAERARGERPSKTRSRPSGLSGAGAGRTVVGLPRAAAGAANHPDRRLRRRPVRSAWSARRWSRATGCRSWRIRSIRCTPSGLHGKLYEFVKEREGAQVAISRRHLKIRFQEFPYGIYKQRLLEGQTEDADDWTVGHPMIFPNMVAPATPRRPRATTPTRFGPDGRREHAAPAGTTR